MNLNYYSKHDAPAVICHSFTCQQLFHNVSGPCRASTHLYRTNRVVGVSCNSASPLQYYKDGGLIKANYSTGQPAGKQDSKAKKTTDSFNNLQVQ